MSVRKSVFWAFSGQFVSFTIQFVGSVIVARLLSPHAMGIYAVALAVLGIIQIVGTLGLNAYVVRETELTEEKLAAAFTVNAILSIALALIIFGASFAGAAILPDPAAAYVMRLLAVGPLLNVFAFRPGTMLQREMQFKTTSFIAVLGVVINTAVTIGCAYAGLSYMSPAYGGLASGLIGTAIYQVVGRRHVGFQITLAGWRQMLTFGLQIMSISGVAVFASRLSDILLARMLGVTALGLYSRASNISNMIFQNLYGTATGVIFTKLAKDFRETGELKATFLRGYQMISAVMWPLLTGIAILSRPVIYLVYGEKWLPAAEPLALLMLAQILAISFGMNWELLVLRGETARQTKLEVTRSLIGLVLFATGCLFSLVGAALGRVAECLFGLIVYLPHVKRLARTKPGEMERIYWQGALLAAAAAAPSLVVMLFSGWSPRASPLWLAAAVLLGVALWFGLILRLRHPLAEELHIFVLKQTGGKKLSARSSGTA